MIIFYILHSGFVALSTLLLSLVYVILGWWYLLLPPFKRFRHFYYFIAVPWIFIVMRVFLYTRLKVIGKKNVDPKRGTLYICNHQSWIDVPFVLRYTHALAVAKKEVRRLPLVGLLIMYAGPIYVDRDDKSSRLSIVKSLIQVFKNNHSINIFPEGTRSRDGSLLKPNLAAIKLCYKLKVPVVPMSIEGTRDILPRKRFYLKCFQKVILKINEPIHPENFENDSLFAEACWGKVNTSHQEVLKEFFPNKYHQIYEN